MFTMVSGTTLDEAQISNIVRSVVQDELKHRQIERVKYAAQPVLSADMIMDANEEEKHQ